MLKLSNSFIKGVSRAIDLQGALKRPIDINNGPKTDMDALRGDWQNVGKDIQKGIRKYRTSVN